MTTIDEAAIRTALETSGLSGLELTNAVAAVWDVLAPTVDLLTQVVATVEYACRDREDGSLIRRSAGDEAHARANFDPKFDVLVRRTVTQATRTDWSEVI